MPAILVIGYGNTLLSDDSVGALAATELENRLSPLGVTVLVRHSLTPELAADLREADAAVFIDSRADAPAGRVDISPIEAVADQTMAMVHFLSPAGLLTWTRQLYGRAPAGWVASMGGLNFEMGEQLSPPVAQALPQLITQVADLVRELLRSGEPLYA